MDLTRDDSERSQPHATHSTLAGQQAGKSGPTRRDPEKRRLQNLRAQKKYREKKRQRIAELETLAGLIRQPPNTEQPTQDGEAVLTQASGSECQDLGRILPRDLLMVPGYPSNTYTAIPCQPSFGEQQKPHYGVVHDALWTPTALRHISGLSISHGTDCASDTPPYLNCGCNIPHIQLIMPAYLINRCRIPTYNRLADPYRNSLRFDRECIGSALLQNCMSIGITTDMWCAYDSVSPFFRSSSSLSFPSPLSSTTGQADSSSLVRSVQGIFRTLKRDMQPCPEQILITHHPYIDIFPIPTLRAKLILNMGLYDEREFFYDTLDGLICWSSSSMSRNNGVWNGSGTPWEARNWEAKEWFIQKWMFLLGGEDEELVRQSRWWRSMRGEEEQL